MNAQTVPSPSRWDANHVCRLAQALKRVANITHDLEPDDVAATLWRCSPFNRLLDT
jgi:hypothetical protein